MTTENNNSNTGIGFWGALGILFIGLKLGGVIDWSWWIVLAPLWGPLALVAFIGLLALIFYALSDWMWR